MILTLTNRLPLIKHEGVMLREQDSENTTQRRTRLREKRDSEKNETQRRTRLRERLREGTKGRETKENKRRRRKEMTSRGDKTGCIS